MLHTIYRLDCTRYVTTTPHACIVFSNLGAWIGWLVLIKLLVKLRCDTISISLFCTCLGHTGKRQEKGVRQAHQGLESSAVTEQWVVFRFCVRRGVGTLYR